MQTKGELITACIKLMYDNTDRYIDPDNVSFAGESADDISTKVESAEYAHRTANIIEAINRAFYRIYSYGKLPYRELVIGKADEPAIAGKLFSTYNLKSLASDLGRVIKILYVDNRTGNVTNDIPVTYLANGKVVLPTIYKDIANKDGYYSITYEGRVKEIKYTDPDTLDLTTYGYTEEMLNYIPYSVKADLYEEDNPEMAYASRNLFETYIQGLPDNESDIYDVENVLNVW